jgi:hypothetical protein
LKKKKNLCSLALKDIQAINKTTSRKQNGDTGSAEKHYKKRPIDLLRMWHVKIETWILEQAGIEQVATLVEKTPLKLLQGGTK